MFQSAAFKLTLYYLAIIMTLSVVFSFIVFRLSTEEINRGLRRPQFGEQITVRTPDGDFEQFRRDRLDESSDNLRLRLIVFNLLTLLAGGGLSYLLARRTLQPIEEAMEAQSRFTSDASHELRTPLTVMQTEIEVALRTKKLDAASARALLQSNLEEINKLRTLSDSLLRLARQDVPLDSAEDFVLDEIGTEAIHRVMRAAQHKAIGIENKFGAYVLQGDAEMIIEALVILLDNAIKYSPNDSTIELKSQLKNDTVFIAVKDQGQGIKASDVPHIFDRFYRADQSRSAQNVEGYGLGLSIAQKIVQLNRGTLSVKSTIGKGSTFTIKLPYQKS